MDPYHSCVLRRRIASSAQVATDSFPSLVREPGSLERPLDEFFLGVTGCVWSTGRIASAANSRGDRPTEQGGSGRGPAGE